MFQRNITRKDVKEVLKNGKVIETYYEDKPYPSKLMFAFIEDIPIHVVVAQTSTECYIITAYIPSKEFFYEDFITRRK
jgi:hypothetical protein